MCENYCPVGQAELTIPLDKDEGEHCNGQDSEQQTQHMSQDISTIEWVRTLLPNQSRQPR